METRNPSLYAIGEAFDVTGWPGGCNFQLARANGVAAGDAPVGWRRPVLPVLPQTVPRTCRLRMSHGRHEPVVTATPIGHNVRDS